MNLYKKKIEFLVFAKNKYLFSISCHWIKILRASNSVNNC